MNTANYDWLREESLKEHFALSFICASPWPGDCDGTKLMKLQFVNHLCWTLLEAERAVWFTVRVQLHLVSTVHRLKIDACPNPHLHPHAHSLSFPLSLQPKAESKSALNRPGVPAHPIAHEKQIGPSEVSPELWGPHCPTALWHKTTMEALSPAITQAQRKGQKTIQLVINPSAWLWKPENGVVPP